MNVYKIPPILTVPGGATVAWPGSDASVAPQQLTSHTDMADWNRSKSLRHLGTEPVEPLGPVRLQGRSTVSPSGCASLPAP